MRPEILLKQASENAMIGHEGFEALRYLSILRIEETLENPGDRCLLLVNVSLAAGGRCPTRSASPMSFNFDSCAAEWALRSARRPMLHASTTSCSRCDSSRSANSETLSARRSRMSAATSSDEQMTEASSWQERIVSSMDPCIA